jgi:hypothetical protein
VKLFLSGKPDECGGYQIASIIKSSDGREWSQKVHLNFKLLDNKRQWTVSSVKGSSAKHVNRIEAAADHTFVRVDANTGRYYMENDGQVDEQVKGKGAENGTMLHDVAQQDYASVQNSVALCCRNGYQIRRR